MSSQLFAFRLAKPMEVSLEDAPVGAYDPVSQTSTWEGGSPALAVSCTTGGTHLCYAYGSYCNYGAGSPNRKCD